MNCYYHLERESTTHCVVCGKALCNKCIHVYETQPHCKDCVTNLGYSPGLLQLVLPAILCGAAAGILGAAPVCGCFLVMGLGALAVLITKRVSHIKGKISQTKAAFAGGITGLTASVTLWVILWITFEDAGLAMSMMMVIHSLGYFSNIVLWAAISVVLNGVSGAIGGVIANELTK